MFFTWQIISVLAKTIGYPDMTEKFVENLTTPIWTSSTELKRAFMFGERDGKS